MKTRGPRPPFGRHASSSRDRPPAPHSVAGSVLLVLLLGASWVTRDLGASTAVTWGLRLLLLAAGATLVSRWLRELRELADRELRLTRAEAELRAQREVMIQTVSHEFRTPLAILHGVTETLIERDGLDERRRRALLLSARNAARRLETIIGVVLAVVETAGADEHEVIELNELVEDLAREFASMHAAERLRVELAPDAQALVSNPERIRLIMRAIVENGLRFSSPGGPVTVHTNRGGDTFETRVRDQGRGMDPELLGRAFEPLVQGDSTTTREHGGLGIGLFAARQATVQLGGDIELIAREDGVDVVVRLPQRRDADRQLARRPG